MACAKTSDCDVQDDQIHDQTTLLCSTSAPNEKTPIFRLPDELLLAILKQVQDLHRTAVTLPDHVQWMKLVEEDNWVELITPSHVCRQWRTITLDCPTLWSRIILSEPDIMEEMLSRSSSSPLSIAIQHMSIIDRILPSLASKQLLDAERLERLHLSLPMNGLQRILGAVTAGTTFPYLRSLFVYDTGRWTDANAADHHYPYAIPTHILSLPMPCLQNLYISYCTIPWDSLQHCCSLVSMRLEYVSTPSREQFYGLLASNIGLETLYLRSALPRPSSEKIDPARLPNLSSCEITEATVSECFDFQRHISYPIEKAKVQFCASEPDVIDITLTSALLFACQESFHHPRSSCLLLEAFRGIPKIVVSSTPSNDCWIPSSDDEFSCSIDFTDYSLTAYDNRQFRWLELLSVPNIEKLIANTGANSISEDEWLHFFDRHPGITTLRICDYSTDMMLTLLSKSHVDDIPDEPRSSPEEHHPSRAIRENLLPCLPNLVTIELEGFAPGYSSESEEFTRSFELLRNCLSKRRGYGLQVQQLKLWSCQNISVAAVNILEDDVGQVMHIGA